MGGGGMEEREGGLEEGKHTRRKGEIPRVNNNDFVSGGVSYFLPTPELNTASILGDNFLAR